MPPITAAELQPPQPFRLRDRPMLIERAMLVYILVVIALLTLSPFRFEWPSQWRISGWSDLRDAPANFLLFLPVGYFFRLAMPPTLPRGALFALMFGGALSASIETLQLFLPDRLTSVFDLLGNSTGCAAGAILCNAARRHLDRVLPAVLTLEHPLLELVYLTLPLMWLSSVGVHDESRVWLLAPLGLAGATTLCGLWRYRLAGADSLPRPLLAMAVLAWFLFGAVIGINAAPHVVAPCAVLIFATAIVHLYLPRLAPVREARNEYRVLALVWPCYAIYLLMLVLWPLPPTVEPFTLTFGYPELNFHRDLTLRVAEQLGALTLFGYLYAESCGRSRLQPRARQLRNLLAGVVCALVLEAIHGYLPGDRASVARWLIGCAAAAFGTLLYVARLNVILLFRSRRAGQPPIIER